ncbi:cell division topological specificity factor [Natranaerovirga pectinivora]|uniref:Cell division topological specificity factor n=1 Tax=Natranaerovirga pectinivora TaxID=682400 RepID=A0A4R3MM95_9FIRM|nr:cell division topological specificity factor MinE [Natranaerovirga pectinivora]TCT14965.1 cell division topological specificity factor [Natranaerovirga pectinivora]
MSLANILNRKASSSTAKDRLKLLLIHDRANCSPEVLEMIKSDIIDVISNYMEIDRDGIEIQITQAKSDSSDMTVPALYANIPIKSLRSLYNK